MRFVDFVCAEVGTRNWCVAPRLGSRMAATYDLAIPPKRYAELEREWQRRYAPTPEMLVEELLAAVKVLEQGYRVVRIAQGMTADEVASLPAIATARSAIARAEAVRRAA